MAANWRWIYPAVLCSPERRCGAKQQEPRTLFPSASSAGHSKCLRDRDLRRTMISDVAKV